ncbi:hypothetical protein ROZALSC1DRAFT_29527, partial [Rozella allomycis CSF55]
MDAVSRRQVAAAFFIFLQSLKISECKKENGSNDWLLRFSMLDALFCLVLYLMRIPRLQNITSRRWFLIFTLLISVNTCVHYWYSYEIKVDLVLTTHPNKTEERINIDNIIGDRLKGTVDVRILPWNTFEFNPGKRNYCIHDKSFPAESNMLKIQENDKKNCIPIITNEKGARELIYSINSINYTMILTETDNCIPISKPGIYKLEYIKNELKIKSNDAAVTLCPQVRFQETTGNLEICELEKDQVSLPILLKSDNSHVDLTFKLKKPSGDILFSKEFEVVPGQVNSLFLDVGDIDQVGDYLVVLNKIISGEHIVEYEKGNSMLVRKIKAPTGSFDCRGDVELLLNGDVNLPIKLNGHPPFHLNIQHESGKQFSIETNANNYNYNVKESGVYSIKEIKDSKCASKGDSICTVVDVPKPTIDIRFERISSSCSGDQGADFYFSLTGKGPWSIEFEEIHGNRRDKRIINIPSHSYVYKTFPKNSGVYRYQFIKFSDSRYLNIPLDQSFEQEIHPLPEASFLGLTQINKCLNEDLHVPISLIGNFPLSLSIQTLEPSGKINLTKLNDINQNELIFKTNIFNFGGVYSLSLIEVKDKDGCVRRLSNLLEVKINKKIPSISLEKSEFWISEGRFLNIPVNLSGEGPWKVGLIKDSGIYREIELKSSSLLINEAGSYKIVSISDEHCKGTVEPNLEFNVFLHPKPKLLYSINQTSFMHCLNSINKNSVKFDLIGSSPFTLHYKIVINGKVKEMETFVKDKFLEFCFSIPSIDGNVEYQFTHLSDANYEKIPIDNIKILHQVTSPPSIVFPSSIKKVYCIEEELDETEVITLVGKPPFSISLSIFDKNGLESFESFKNINSNKFALLIRPGMTAFKFNNVTDGNSCVSTLENHELLKIHGIEKPFIISDQTDACIGDILGFTLGGAGPWTIKYEFQTLQKPSTVKTESLSTNKFYVHTAFPGTLSIVSICNQFCCSESKSPLAKVHIHDLPLGVLETGKDLQKSIHEGDAVDMTITMQGHPPFD